MTQSTVTTVTPDERYPGHRFEVEQFAGAGTHVVEWYGDRRIGFATMGPVASPQDAVDVYRNEESN